MKAKNPEPQTFVYFSDKIAFQGILPPLLFGCCPQKTLNHKQVFSSMIKHSFQEFFPIISRFFFFGCLLYPDFKNPKPETIIYFSLKKKSFKQFHSSFLSFFGVAAIFRLQREHSCDCVLTDTSLWSLSTGIQNSI